LWEPARLSLLGAESFYCRRGKPPALSFMELDCRPQEHVGVMALWKGQRVIDFRLTFVLPFAVAARKEPAWPRGSWKYLIESDYHSEKGNGSKLEMGTSKAGQCLSIGSATDWQLHLQIRLVPIVLSEHIGKPNSWCICAPISGVVSFTSLYFSTLARPVAFTFLITILSEQWFYIIP
jgi:hypothetical protein